MNKSTLSTIIAAAFALTTAETVKAEGIFDSNKQGQTSAETAGCGSSCGGSKSEQPVNNQQPAGQTQKINTTETTQNPGN